MIGLLSATLGWLARFVAYIALASIAALQLFTFAILALAWFVDADVHVRGGAPALVLEALVLALCAYGLRALGRPRAA